MPKAMTEAQLVEARDLVEDGVKWASGSPANHYTPEALCAKYAELELSPYEWELRERRLILRYLKMHGVDAEC